MKIIELYNFYDNLFPKALSCPWDNDGLMYSIDFNKEVSGVVFSLDPTLDAIEYCKSVGANVLVTHHPLIFNKIGNLVDSGITQRRLLNAIKSDISIFSFHTRLDAYAEGVNYCLANLVGLKNIQSFGDAESPTLAKIGTVNKTTLEDFSKVVKSVTNSNCVLYGGNNTVEKIAVVGGSGKDYINEAMKLGADTFLTGEVSYNSMIDYIEYGINIITAGHFFTEFPVCNYLSNITNKEFKITTYIYNNNLIKSV